MRDSAAPRDTHAPDFSLGGTFLVALLENAVIGVSVVNTHRTELAGLVVAPHLRRRGVATALLAAARAFADSRGFAELSAPLEPTGWLERRGWVRTADRLALHLSAPRGWHIRPAHVSDCPAICEVHLQSIRELCAPHYTPDQVQAWCDGKNPAMYEMLLQKSPWFVAEESGRVLGFGDVGPARSELPGEWEVHGLYFSPAAAGRGIGGAMMRRLESLAREAGATSLFVRGTVNAAPFYSHMGFAELGRDTHRTRSGVELPSVAMRKTL
ncbi:MAG: GNAT family N-acetyltransferase [Planctomycetes bacterium]|nr:GNAT family N-acetyltransferase [Planctomycetota bacterium]